MDTSEVFRLLGYEQKWETTANCLAYVWDFGNLRLSAIECIGKFYRTVLFLTGVKNGVRSIGMINFEMPLEVECFEQGVALIAYAVGADFMPTHPTSWLSDGRKWQGFLPWERARQLREQLYAAQPKCWVARDWFRVVRPRLYAMAKEAAKDDLAWLTFDGEVLQFATPDAAEIVPAAGEAWPDRWAIKAVAVDPVEVVVWENTLAICSRRWRLVSQAGTNASDARPIHRPRAASLPVDRSPATSSFEEAPWHPRR